MVLIGAPLALTIGMILRRTRNVAIHILAHALNGLLAAGIGLYALLIWMMNWSQGNWSLPSLSTILGMGNGYGYYWGTWWYYLPYAVTTVPAAVIGWNFTMRRALRPRQPKTDRIDLDAASEDTAAADGTR
jgi:hypothetical protein